MNQATYELAAAPAGRGIAKIWRRLRDIAKRVDETLSVWHLRAQSRKELARMDDRLLRDAGLDRAEAYKPFWRK